jgi:Uma2 family endonuclease
MNKALRKPMTQEEFFAWEGHAEGLYEFDGFQPVAMNGGSINHWRIVRNIQRAVDSRLRGTCCEFFGAGTGVNTVGKAVRYPDGLVTCSQSNGTSFMVPGVVIVVEVVSPSSRRLDRVIKKKEYAVVPSIRRYVIIESETTSGVVCARSHADEPWTDAKFKLSDVLAMPEISIEVPVTEFYEGVHLGETDNSP